MKLTIALALLAVLISSLALKASTAEFDLAHSFSGTAPAGTTSPWLKVKLQDGLAANTVRLTFDATNLTGSEFVSEWNVNFDPSITNFTPLNFTLLSTTADLTSGNIRTGINAYKADGDGYYDISFNFPTSGNRLTAGETFQVDISRASGLSVSDFLYQSVGGAKGAFYSAAHVQNTGTAGNQSAWIGAQTAVIPEPSTYALIFGGAALVFTCTRRRCAR